MIALFTDFGLHGPYTGQMKAVLYDLAPGKPVVDLFADAPAGNPKASAYLLAAFAAWFPEPTVFLTRIESLDRDSEQRQIHFAALEPGNLQDRGESDKEHEQQDELVERHDDRVLAEHAGVPSGVQRAKRVRPHVEAERGE